MAQGGPGEPRRKDRWQLGTVATRTCLYSGGLARISRKGPEPGVLSWADVESVTISTDHDEGTRRPA